MKSRRLNIFAALPLAISFIAIASATATPAPTNWNEYVRPASKHIPAQAYAYLIARHVLRDAHGQQVLPVLVFSCVNHHRQAELSLNDVSIKTIARTMFQLDGIQTRYRPWHVLSNDSLIIYAGSVIGMIRSLEGHRRLNMRFTGQSGQVIEASIAVFNAHAGLMTVRTMCRSD
ncbi:type VI secretion system-associated protein TagO [Acidihalobacter ferrooxydans]|uniref:FlgO domain-containing protein n=1 Tax=Acidihalobacter ferrooxydans TaxID=1765967 RepID=A0A1P8UKN8_9GAMM|nr:type VI secretion system-associated protein TagO [Acidihalobacter ferrooxydans]APZ44417.1 hypothetical protein BW247_16055 [Acidihalobacter ferrooxydans]